jgi:hypothetical protein
VKQVENTVRGMKDKVEELDQTVKDHEIMLKKNMNGMSKTSDTP